MENLPRRIVNFKFKRGIENTMLSLSVQVSISRMETVRMGPENNDLGIGGPTSSESGKDRCLHSLGEWWREAGSGRSCGAGERRWSRGVLERRLKW
jgi:hypothetical protein